MTDWSEVVREHGPIVWRTVYRLLNHEADAADCFQNTFVSALKLAGSQRIRHWPSLLKRMATTSALERLRQRYRESERLSVLPERSTVDPKGVEPGRAAEASELAEHLCDALGRLDARQAQVFCLACLEGLSYREIAQQIGITVNHVGVLLNRAKAALRERLRAHRPASAGDQFQQDTPP